MDNILEFKRKEDRRVERRTSPYSSSHNSSSYSRPPSSPYQAPRTRAEDRMRIEEETYSFKLGRMIVLNVAIMTISLVLVNLIMKTFS